MQNITSTSRRWPLALGLVGLLALGGVACASGSGGGGNRAPAGNASGPNAVHMDNSRFVTPTANIRAGENVTLVADTFAPHVIANGTWTNGQAQRAVEPGAPEMKDLQIEGNKAGSVGPFTQAAAITCTARFTRA